jgi:hypothetical protein
MKDTVFIVGAAVVAVAAGVLILTSSQSSNTSSGSSDTSGNIPSATVENSSSGNSIGTSQNNPIPAWEGYTVPAYYQWHSAFNGKLYTSYVNSQSLFNSINASLGYTNK